MMWDGVLSEGLNKGLPVVDNLILNYTAMYCEGNHTVF